jgi:hypothetical protein
MLKNESFSLHKKPIPIIPIKRIPIVSLSFGRAKGVINQGIKKHKKYLGDI